MYGRAMRALYQERKKEVISIPSDLRKNKDTIMGNMDLRECICLVLGLLLALGILYYIRVILEYKRIVIVSLIAGIFVIPFLFIGFKRINGMKIEDYFKVYVNNKIIANSSRINICPYVGAQVKNCKYELIRYYKLKLQEEVVILRDMLKEKNNLILTEYIDYNDSKYAIFRLDGKELVLNQIKRNKELIENKKREIKDFIRNAMKTTKQEKIALTADSRSERLRSLRVEVDALKSELKILKSKTFDTLKDEVDIFENLSSIKCERIQFKNNKKKKELDIDNPIISLRKMLSEDVRNLYQLHLFNKDKLREFIETIDNKIVFINADNKVDVYTYRENTDDIGLADLIELDKKDGLYNNSILSLEARNYYNHYRSINNLEEIL